MSNLAAETAYPGGAMDPLRLSALGGTAAMALNPALVIPKVQPGNVQGTAGTDATQGLVQDLFLQTLQAASALAQTPATGPAPTPGVTDSLLAALTAVPAPTAATATADTPTAATAAAPATTLATDLATPLPATAALAVPELATVPPAALPDSSTLAFALETALRFGAGVVPGAGPAFQLPDAGAGLMRDATAVPRQPHLLLNTGRSGAEVLAQPQTGVPQAVNAYRTAAVAEPPAGVDLLA